MEGSSIFLKELFIYTSCKILILILIRRCEEEHTCCPVENGGYGCCPLRLATCCNDKVILFS